MYQGMKFGVGDLSGHHSEKLGHGSMVYFDWESAWNSQATGVGVLACSVGHASFFDSMGRRRFGGWDDGVLAVGTRELLRHLGRLGVGFRC
jgi:hypothetical protein